MINLDAATILADQLGLYNVWEELCSINKCWANGAQVCRLQDVAYENARNKRGQFAYLRKDSEIGCMVT